MKTKYQDLINQTFDFPQEEFSIDNDKLHFHNINLFELIKKYGAPLRFTYLDKISENINKAKSWFENSMIKYNYPGKYYYSYCTKSSHFKFIMDEVLMNDVHIETSSAYDIDIVKALKCEGKISNNTYILCNGFKRDKYINNIASLINEGHKNCIPIIDNYEEINLLNNNINESFNIGIRIASEEDPKFEFYTSRLGIGYKNIIPFFQNEILNNKKIELKMLHFFINTGISDSSYYWNELLKCIDVYVKLKKICPSLDSLNIGGGFPIKNSLNFDFDYEYIIDEIINQINIQCKNESVDCPNIFTEFGSFTVGESSGMIYEILYQKQQNDREKWNIINSSFITTLPDTWSINKKFIMLPINGWNTEYERVLLGGLTCDSDDYYNSEQHINAIYMPKYNSKKPLYIGFFNTGAYQENIGGYGGLQHCLIPNPKHILIKRKKNKYDFKLWRDEQTNNEFLKILGYD